MDMKESSTPDSSIECLVELNNAIDHYEEFMKDSDSSANGSQGSLMNFINDETTDLLRSSLS